MAAASFDKVYVLTREFNREFHRPGAIPANVEMIYYDLPFGGAGVHHKARFIKAYYSIWQWFAARRVARLDQLRDVRLVHHVTYNVIDMPGFLWRLPGKRFVWGPVGGGQVPPASLAQVFTQKQWAKERLRAAMKRLARRNPLVRGAAGRAALVLAANEETAALLPKQTARIEPMLETAIERDMVSDAPRARSTDGPLRLLWLANMEPNKALCLATDALSQVREKLAREVTLDVIGEGGAFAVERARLEGAPGVTLHGRVPFGEVAGHMRAADAFLFTSVRDTSGNVMLEAMAAGTPVIALDHQGAREILREGGGVLVEVGEYDETVARIADAIIALAADPARWSQLSEEARAQAANRLSWDAKRATMQALWSQVLAQAG